jgi:hypothetical protein
MMVLLVEAIWLFCGAALWAFVAVGTAATTTTAAAAAAGEIPTLDVAYNATDGNATVRFGGHRRVVGGIPTFYSLSMDGETKGNMPDGTHLFTWSQRGPNGEPRAKVAYDSSSRTYSCAHLWGSWSIQHKINATTNSLDLQISISNTYNRSHGGSGALKQVTLLLFGRLGFGPSSLDLGYCPPHKTPDMPHGGCAGVRAGGTCDGCWTKPQACGQPHCSSDRPQVIVADNASFGALVTTMPSNPPNATFMFEWVDGFFLKVSADLAAGQTMTETLSLRFAAPERTPAPHYSDRLRALLEVANDTFEDWRTRVPITLKWPDRGPIGGLFPSNYPGCKSSSPASCPNPRGWTWMGGKDAPSISTPAGIAAFQAGALKWMNKSVNYCLEYMGGGNNGPALCQGLTVWSLEGQQYPQDISYIGAPDMLAALAPEMDAIADKMFKLITDVGLKCGVTLRPQQLTQNPAWKPDQIHPFKYYQKDLLNPDNTSDTDAVAALLVRKAGYAYRRWGCTMFYTDTTVTQGGHVIPPDAFIKAAAALPQVVFFPEESTFAYRSAVAPLQDNWGGAALGSPVAADVLYGRAAFGFELMQFRPGGTPAPGAIPIWDNESLVLDYARIVKRGDVLRYQGWYNASVNVFIKKVYEVAAQL